MSFLNNHEKLWKGVVVVRLLSVIVLSTSYIHPDEFFQSTEVVAGDILDVQHQRTWEFTSQNPIRNIVLPYILCAPIFFVLRLLQSIGVACPCLLVILPRISVAIFSIIVDRCVFLMCRKFNNDGYTSLLFYSTSYVAFTFMTHTFSNTLETALFSALLVTTFSACQSRNRPCPNDTKAIAAILAVGVFNRPTFVVFAALPVAMWFWNSVRNERTIADKLNEFIGRVSVMALITGLISVVFIVVDTLYYRIEFVQHLPKDFQTCLFDKSKVDCFGNLFTNYKPSIVVTPLNFLMYNMNTSNLEQHGIQPWYFHAMGSLPLLFGPLVVFLSWRLLKNILNIFLGGSLKIPNEFHLDDINIISCFAAPFIVLSCVSHKEPRFLLPLVPLGIVIATKSIQRLRVKAPLIVSWFVFNILAVLVYGWLHQGGITPAISHLHSKIRPYEGDSHVVFYHTYSPPEHLFLYPQESKYQLTVHDLGGASFEKLERKMERIRVAASTAGDNVKIWVVAPKTVVADMKKLNVKFGAVDKFWHLSTEDPPRFSELIKGKISLSDFYGDFSLVVAEVKSWKLFKDRG